MGVRVDGWRRDMVRGFGYDMVVRVERRRGARGGRRCVWVLGRVRHGCARLVPSMLWSSRDCNRGRAARARPRCGPGTAAARSGRGHRRGEQGCRAQSRSTTRQGRRGASRRAGGLESGSVARGGVSRCTVRTAGRRRRAAVGPDRERSVRGLAEERRESCARPSAGRVRETARRRAAAAAGVRRMRHGWLGPHGLGGWREPDRAKFCGSGAWERGARVREAVHRRARGGGVGAVRVRMRVSRRYRGARECRLHLCHPVAAGHRFEGSGGAPERRRCPSTVGRSRVME